jgi:hypothetical protein
VSASFPDGVSDLKSKLTSIIATKGLAGRRKRAMPARER